MVLLIGLLALACGASAPDGDSITNAQLHAQIRSQQAPVILDVRTTGEFEAGHLPGAIHIPYDELAQRLSELPTEPEDRLVVYCHSGKRASIAGAELNAAGYGNVIQLEGHMVGWQRSSLPTEQ